jgi:hypothetical protein
MSFPHQIRQPKLINLKPVSKTNFGFGCPIKFCMDYSKKTPVIWLKKLRRKK